MATIRSRRRSGERDGPGTTATEPFRLAIDALRPAEPPEQSKHRRPRHGSEKPVLDDTADDAGQDDDHERKTGVQLAAAGGHTGTDDDEVARDGDGQACLLHQDQAGDRDDRGELGRHRSGRQDSLDRRCRVSPAAIARPAASARSPMPR